MSKPKRHHYLPQFYLKNFTNTDGLLWVFDCDAKEYRQQHPKQTTVQCNYYTFCAEDGKKQFEIEEFFSIIEGKTKGIIDKIDAKHEITEEDKEILAAFISFQKCRVPAFEKEVNEFGEKVRKRTNPIIFSSKERVESLINRYAKETAEKNSITPEKLIDFVQGNRYRIDFPRKYSIEKMLHLGERLIRYFVQMDWCFLRAPLNSSFIVSDNPFLLVPPEDFIPNRFYGVGIITPGAEKVIPLSQKTCLVMGDHGERILSKDLNRKVVMEINYSIAANSDRFVISRDRLLLERIIRTTKIDQWKTEERIHIG